MKRSKRNQRKEGVRREIIYSKPMKSIMVEYYPTMRFTWKPAAPGVLSATFSANNLLNLVCVSVTATTLKTLFSLVKLRGIRIRAYALQSSGAGVPSFATLSMQDGGAAEAGSGVVYETAPIGLEVGEINVRPKPTQRWGQWANSNDALSFSITAEDCDIVIELDLSLRCVNGSANSALFTGVALSPGGVYFRGLDSQALAATVFPVICQIGDAA